MTEMFPNATAYEDMMGRWSKRLASMFLEFAETGDADRILDVGCGTGSLVQVIFDRTKRTQIIGIDPSQPSIDYSRVRFSDSRITFDCGSALKLPYPDASFAHSLSLLVFQFLSQPGIAANEMRRVTRPGGTVAACTWDRTGLEMSELFWQEAVRLDPGAEERAQRPKTCNEEGQLAELWRATGLKGIKEVALEMRTEFTSFNDFWVPYTKGVAPQGVYVASLSPEKRDLLRDALWKRFVGDRDRPFSLRAKALAVRGIVPS
jgi:ubiquinone/menaquinone biosynthesis C-methylase UbiE